VLDRLKRNASTRHVPVHVITTDEDRDRGVRSGAIGVATKPLQSREGLDDVLRKLKKIYNRRERNVLLVQRDAELRDHLAELLKSDNVQVRGAANGAEALRELDEALPDCIVLDPQL